MSAKGAGREGWDNDATLSIARATSNEGPDYITLRIRLSGGRSVDVEMTPEAFAYALTGRAEEPCIAALRQR